MSFISCMGGMCPQRENCIHHLRNEREVPVERRCTEQEHFQQAPVAMLKVVPWISKVVPWREAA